MQVQHVNIIPYITSRTGETDHSISRYHVGCCSLTSLLLHWRHKPEEKHWQLNRQTNKQTDSPISLADGQEAKLCFNTKCNMCDDAATIICSFNTATEAEVNKGAWSCLVLVTLLRGAQVRLVMLQQVGVVTSVWWWWWCSNQPVSPTRRAPSATRHAGVDTHTLQAFFFFSTPVH